MKRSYAIAAAVGAAAVLGITGTALAAGGDDAGPSPSPSPSSEVLRGDGSLDDNSSPSSSPSPSSPSPFETVEPGSVTPSPRGSSPSARSGLGSAAGSAVNSISIAQAKAQALTVVGGGRITKIEAETEHGRAIWEVEVTYNGAEHDLDIDRKTGSVTDHDIDSNNNHGATEDDSHHSNDDAHHGDDDGHHGDDDSKGRGGDDNRSDRHGNDD